MTIPLRARRAAARSIWQAGLDAVAPRGLMKGALSRRGKMLICGDARIDLEQTRRLHVVGAGKAGRAMTEALAEIMGKRWMDRLEASGTVAVPDDLAGRVGPIELHAARSGTENVPCAAGVKGARRILERVAAASRDDLVVALISGGGSALLPLPAEGITLARKLGVTRRLLAAGATIEEMNAVRKHLSAIKGGRLAQAFGGRKMLALIISDVVGDPLDVIASGPTAPDASTFSDALDVLRRHRLLTKVPSAVRRHLEAGVAGEIPETPKRASRRTIHQIIGNGRTAIDAAARAARAAGFRVVDLGAHIEGDTREVANSFASRIRSLVQEARPARKPVCILSGGETTVTLPRRHGIGGRNQEMALAMAHALGMDIAGVTVICGGTDGEDGPTDAAGAIADDSTMKKATKAGLDVRDHLERHDSHTFFDRIGGLIRTGPTGTNVMDLRVFLVS